MIPLPATPSDQRGQPGALDAGDSLAKGLFHLWPLTEGAGQKGMDYGPRHATITGWSGSPTWGKGKYYGAAVQTNGSSSYVVGPENVPLGTSVVGLSLWVKFTSALGNFTVIVAKSALSPNSTLWDWGLLSNATGTGVFLIRNGANVSAASWTPTVGRWYHIVASMSDAESTFYVDGKLLNTQGGIGSGATANNARAITLGGTLGGGFQAAAFQNVRVYNRKLFATDAARLYAEPWAPLGILPATRRLSINPSSATAYTLAIDSGTYVTTGNAIGLRWDHKITIDSGTYATTGNDIGLRAARTMSVDAGTYALTGNAVGLSYGRTMTISAGSYVTTGNDVGLARTYSLLFTPGNYTITGNAVGLIYTRTAVRTRIGRPRVTEFQPNEGEHRRQIARSLNEVIAGRLDCVVDLTLDAGATSTTLIDSRANVWTAALMTPRTANAAAEMAAGGLYAVPSNGTVTVYHANNAQTDRDFTIALIG